MSDVCPKCGGTGFVVGESDRGVLTGTRCDCRETGVEERLLAAARIPRRYEHCTFDEFECHDATHERALAIARAWVDAFPGVEHGLMFLGEPGRGKTHLAVAVMRELIRRKRLRGVFWEQSALLRRLRETWDGSPDNRGAAGSESEVWQEVIGADLVVLDDLGAGRTTPWTQQVLHDVITGRYNAIGALVITTNLRTGDEPTSGGGRRGGARALDEPLSLKERLGDALMSRLHEMCQPIVLRGKDYRSEILPHRHDP